ncbi:MAG: hypothetical protein IH865_03975 [Chloroflexi bacterium]|nr:hypothetical protein [Chloroflexota bacterium]
MSDAQAGRRRRRRRTRRREEGKTYQSRETLPAQPKPSPRSFPEWNWRTFPVFFAFILGVVIMGIAIASPALGLVFFFGGLFGLAYGAAHILARLWVGRRRG